MPILTSLFAYLDPGSGSFFLQFALAALLGALYSVKLYWKKICAFFTERFPGRNKQEDK